jgi:hypothetical protein
MKRVYILFVVAVVLLFCACSETPGPVFAHTSVKQPVFDVTGLRLSVAVECQRTVRHWYLWATSPVPAECPKQLMAGDISLRTPWGQVYRGTVALEAAVPIVQQRSNPVEHGVDSGVYQPTQPPPPLRHSIAGVLALKIDWKTSGVDPLRLPDTAKFQGGWAVFSKDGQVNASLTLSHDEIRSMLAAIGQALGGDDAVGRADEHATLTAKLSNETDAGGANRIMLSVTNQGPDPAYKVVAQLRSSSTAIHGAQLSFGRINRGETKNRIAQLSGISDADELNPTVVAAVTSSNAPPATTSSRLRLTAAKHPHLVPLQLSCAPVDKELMLGQRLRIQCESTNPGEILVRGVSLQVAVGTAAVTPAAGPMEVAPHGHVKFEFTPTLPANVKTGSSVPITITMTAPDATPVQQQIAVRIIEAPGVCKQGKLTRDVYRIKRKRLQDALASGALTQGEFDNYDAEMVGCLE